MHDIAKRLGLSRSTISYAMSPDWQKRRIPAATRERILKVAEEFGYRPNQLAVALRTQRTKTIGVLLHLISPNQNDLMAGINKVLGNEYTAFLGISQYEPEREVQILQSFEERMVDGYIVMTSTAKKTRDCLESLLDQGKPVIQVDHHFEDLKAGVVEVDHFTLAKTCTEHLLALGHTRICMIRPLRSHSGGLARQAGYESAMGAAGLASIFFPDKPMETRSPLYYEEQARRAMASMQHPFGIVSNSFPSILRAIVHAGVRCPEDVSVASVDASSLSPYRDILKVNPTNAVWSVEEMGIRAAELLKNGLHYRDESWRKLITIGGHFIIGQSTCPPRTR